MASRRLIRPGENVPDGGLNEILKRAGGAAAAGAGGADARACTCHPDDNPPAPCPQKFSLAECRAAGAAAAAGGGMPDIVLRGAGGGAIKDMGAGNLVEIIEGNATSTTAALEDAVNRELVQPFVADSEVAVLAQAIERHSEDVSKHIMALAQDHKTAADNLYQEAELLAADIVAQGKKAAARLGDFAKSTNITHALISAERLRLTGANAQQGYQG